MANSCSSSICTWNLKCLITHSISTNGETTPPFLVNLSSTTQCLEWSVCLKNIRGPKKFKGSQDMTVDHLMGIANLACLCSLVPNIHDKVWEQQSKYYSSLSAKVSQHIYRSCMQLTFMSCVMYHQLICNITYYHN